MNLEEYEIQGVVDSYITKCLSENTSFSKKILEHKNLQLARKYTYWTKRYSLDNIEAFDGTVIMPNICTQTTEWLLVKIDTYFEMSAFPALISVERFLNSSFEIFPADIKAGPESLTLPVTFNSEIDYFEGKEVYYIVDKKNYNKDKIEVAINASGDAGPYSISMLLQLPKNLHIEQDSLVKKDLLDLLAQMTDHLVIGAFDLDGYIICSFDEKL